jgi:hypothetical protein
MRLSRGDIMELAGYDAEVMNEDGDYSEDHALAEYVWGLAELLGLKVEILP